MTIFQGRIIVYLLFILATIDGHSSQDCNAVFVCLDFKLLKNRFLVSESVSEISILKKNNVAFLVIIYYKSVRRNDVFGKWRKQSLVPKMDA